MALELPAGLVLIDEQRGDELAAARFGRRTGLQPGQTTDCSGFTRPTGVSHHATRSCPRVSSVVPHILVPAT